MSTTSDPERKQANSRASREPSIRPEITEAILQRVLTLAPEFSPKYTGGSSHVPTVDDLRPLIISENCGLRPGRKGGIRLESDVSMLKGGGSLPVVYNYG